MFGRFFIVFLLLSVILQTNLFARDCITYTDTWLDFTYQGSTTQCDVSNYAYSDCANGGTTISWNCTSSCVWRGYGHPECKGNVTCCDPGCAADSARCIMAGELFDSQTCTCIPDTTFKCTSVSTENNVIRSQIDYIVHDTDVVKQKYVLGSCIQNNFCEGGGERQTYTPDNPTFAYDSCSYDSISSQRCNFAGQNGSSCRYVCPDGRNWNCRMGWVAGGVDLPQCPSKPWKDCSEQYVARPVTTPPSAIHPDSISAHNPLDGTNSGAPYDNVLSALDDISDRIHQQTMLDFERQYVDEKMYDMVGGYGAFEGDGIWQNTKRIDEDLNDVNANIAETNSGINSVVINQNTIIKNLEHDTIKVEVQNDSLKPLWVLPNWKPLVFAIDTNVQKVEDKLSEVNALVDTLVSDTPRTNKILSGIAPSIGQILDNLDTLIDRIPTPSSIINDMSDSLRSMIQPFYDVIYTDSNRVDSLVDRYDWYTPDTSFIQWQPDSLPNDTLVPMDSVNFVGSFDDVYNYLDSLKREREKQDTTKDTLPLDQMAGDSAEIRTKLTDVFLTDIVLESCFEFHMHPVVNFTLFKRNYSYDLSIVIDFADMFGWDLCELIRKIVEVLTFIAIVFTTIKGYIRAFGGSNIGG